ncbi:hypothetical protein OIDMADRAFT_61252 [Oidiodendron maius Zn]|uniref:Uncharacterized protein n=1 Tax=Oidiodendron maius (strain Zn) TaxID=913774 RepID=A0A0C3GRL1_OIDMZ|nr:hypothetical protein OIDMADRAFT_61252 [Oidiodendron maius Zn]
MPLSTRYITLPLQSSTGLSAHAGPHPAPNVVLHAPPASYGQGIFHATEHGDIDDTFQPQEGKIPEVGIGDYPQIQVPLSRHPSLLSQEEKQSWLGWGEPSLPAVLSHRRSREASKIPCDQFGDKVSLNLAAGKSTANLENDAQVSNSDDTLQAQWGSDPAFTARYFVPPLDQLTELEVSIIWNEYIATILKPLDNFLGTDVEENQQRIIRSYNGGIGIHEVESLTGAALTRGTPSTSLDSIRSTTLQDLTLPPAILHRKPLRRYRMRVKPVLTSRGE